MNCESANTMYKGIMTLKANIQSGKCIIKSCIKKERKIEREKKFDYRFFEDRSYFLPAVNASFGNISNFISGMVTLLFCVSSCGVKKEVIH